MYKYLLPILFMFSICFSDSNKNQFNWTLNLIPTAGQINNKKYFKAVFLGSTQAYSAYKFSHYNDTNQIGKRNTFAWWMLGLYFYGLIDSYVDYNLKNFPNEDKEASN